MSEAGYAGFTDPYLFDQVWINGSWVDQFPVQIDRGAGVWALPTQGGTDIVQRPYRGSLKPALGTKWTFTLTVRALNETAWYAIREAEAAGTSFYFGTGVRRTATFAATAGSTYRLPSPLASGIVTGVTSVTHPTIVKLNGSVNAGAATVTGQNVAAVNTGTITVHYTPVHLVIFTSYPESITEFNSADSAIVLEEVLSA